MLPASLQFAGDGKKEGLPWQPFFLLILTLRYQRFAMYIVTSKPKRISVNSGLVHIVALLVKFGSGVTHFNTAPLCSQRPLPASGNH
jgi:hypothetical protein